MTAPRWFQWLAFAVLLGVCIFAGIQSTKPSHWEMEAKAALAHADSVDARNDSLAALAAAAVARSDSLERRAATGQATGHRLRDRAVALAGPDTAAWVPRAAFDSLLAGFDTLAAAFSDQRRALADLHLALTADSTIIKSQRVTIHDLERVVRSTPRPRGPCGMGVGAGWGLKGPDAVIGVACTVALPRLLPRL